MHPHEIEYVIENLKVLRPCPAILLEGTSMEIPFSAVMEDSDEVGRVEVIDGCLFAKVMDRERVPDEVAKTLLEGFDSDSAWKYAAEDLPDLFKVDAFVGFGKVHTDRNVHRGSVDEIAGRVTSRTKNAMVISVPQAGWEVGLLAAAARNIRIRLK